MFKIIILIQIGADRYQKFIFEILLLSPLPPPLGELCTVQCKKICQLKVNSRGFCSFILLFLLVAQLPTKDASCMITLR